MKKGLDKLTGLMYTIIRKREREEYKMLKVTSYKWSDIEAIRNTLKAENKKFQIWKTKDGSWSIKWMK